MIQFDEHIFQMGWNHQPDKHPDPDICHLIITHLTATLLRWCLVQLEIWPKKSGPLSILIRTEKKPRESLSNGGTYYSWIFVNIPNLHTVNGMIHCIQWVYGGYTWLQNWLNMQGSWQEILKSNSPSTIHSVWFGSSEHFGILCWCEWWLVIMDSWVTLCCCLFFLRDNDTLEVHASIRVESRIYGQNQWFGVFLNSLLAKSK